MISTSHFQRVSEIAYRNWGLHLSEKKMQLVTTRLAKYLRKAPYEGVGEYLDHIETAATPADLLELFDMLSTNVTSFFRNPEVWEGLRRVSRATPESPPNPLKTPKQLKQ